MIKEIAEYIAAHTSLVIGTTLFAGFTETDAPSPCVLIQEVDPAIADYLLTDKVQRPIRIMSRSTSHWTARTNAYTVFDLLHGKMQITLPVVTSGVVYIVNVAGGPPYYIGKDPNNNFVFVFTLMFQSQLQ